MSFTTSTYENFLSTSNAVQPRLFPQYKGYRTDFDIIIVGSGVGGGILADDLADRLGKNKRILILEAGSYLFPSHVYNFCRFPNAEVADKFECKTFWQSGTESSPHYIHEQPQLNFGGRSIFWSGLIPEIQNWELDFFPPRLRRELANEYLREAGRTMNESITMGSTANAIVKELRKSRLSEHFIIRETPRALHQPYLTQQGLPSDNYFYEPTGVFNTAELLINQIGLSPGVSHGDGPGMHLLLNHFVEDVQNIANQRFEIVARDTLNGQLRNFQAGTVVLAGGSIESPKLLRRSSLYHSLPSQVKSLIGRGLTDHPTTDWIDTYATNIGEVPIPKDTHAKIIFYSKGKRNENGQILFPFNVEMNINHEYWHLRENDPNARAVEVKNTGASKVQIKFSFGNCLDGENEVKSAPPYGYVPEIVFRNQKWMKYLSEERFPALAGWNKNYDEIFAVLNDITFHTFSQFKNYGRPCRPENDIWYGQGNKGFGLGTVHHAVGTLRMPHRAWCNGPMLFESVVDEDLRVIGTQHLYVCDMSVMPFSSAANPVRTLAALALRLSQHFG